MLDADVTAAGCVCSNVFMKKGHLVNADAQESTVVAPKRPPNNNNNKIQFSISVMTSVLDQNLH